VSREEGPWALAHQQADPEFSKRQEIELDSCLKLVPDQQKLLNSPRL
jgi:hypothetical protein